MSPSKVAIIAVVLVIVTTPVAGDEVKTLRDRGALVVRQQDSYVSNLVAKCQAKVVEAFYNGRSPEGFRSYVQFESPLQEQEVVKLLLRDHTALPYDPGRHWLTSTNCSIFREPDENRLICEALRQRVANCARYYAEGGHSAKTLFVEIRKDQKLVFHLCSWFYYE